MPKQEYTVSHHSIDDMVDEIMSNENNRNSIDGGDHQVTIWLTKDGERKIMIQGTNSNVTLLTFLPILT